MRIDFTPDPGLFPFESRFYESSAGRVHYIDEGSGVPLLWGMKDPAFRPKATLPRARAAFSDHELVEMHDASHYIQEDAPETIAGAIRSRFL